MKPDFFKGLICLSLVCPALESYEIYGYGEAEITVFNGNREGYLNTAQGLIPQKIDEQFLQNRGYAGFYWKNRIEKLDLSIRDTFQFSLLDNPELLRRISSWDNDLEVMGLLHFTGPAFVRGIVGHRSFEDKRFPEFSNQDLYASLALERQLDPNRRLSAGYARREVNFDVSKADDFTQQDIFVNFLRFSTPRMYTLLKKSGPTSFGRALMSRHFSEGDKQILLEDRFDGVTQLAMDTEGVYREEIVTGQEEGGMAFEAEYRMRDTTLFNQIAHSYLENQFHLRSRLYFDPYHAITLANSYNIRDYQEQIVPDRIMDQEKNITELNWYLGRQTVSLDQTLKLEQVYFRNDKTRDYQILNWEGNVNWELLRGFSAGIFSNWQWRRYDTPREFYTDTDSKFASLFFSWKIRPKVELSAVRDWEQQRIQDFETVIDSSFDLDGSDYRVTWHQNRELRFHLGYRMEEERHLKFFTNDRNESLTYAGTKVAF